MGKALVVGMALMALLGASSRKLRDSQAVESYEVRPGIVATPFYSPSREICEISLERRRYSGETVNMGAYMSRQQIIDIFDDLAGRDERGQPIWGLPEGSEYTDIDNDLRITHLSFEKVTLLMYEQVKPGDSDQQRFALAVISWKTAGCR